MGIFFNTIGCLLWPLRAGPALLEKERNILETLVGLFRAWRREQEDGEEPEGAAELRAGASGKLPQFDQSLDGALLAVDVEREALGLEGDFLGAFLLGHGRARRGRGKPQRGYERA